MTQRFLLIHTKSTALYPGWQLPFIKNAFMHMDILPVCTYACMYVCIPHVYRGQKRTLTLWNWRLCWRGQRTPHPGREERNWLCDQKWRPCPVSLKSLSSVLLKEPCHRKRATRVTPLPHSSSRDLHLHRSQDIRERAIPECSLPTCGSWRVWAEREGSRICLLCCVRT